jgi:hypothetical protein
MTIAELNGGSEEGNIYPSYESGSGQQATRSAYYARGYTDSHGNTEYVYRNAPIPPAERAEQDLNGRRIGELVMYMMQDMEPTDRCLRMPGDYYPVDGSRPGRRGYSKRLGRDLKAMPGDEPYDGENIPVEPEGTD